MEHKKKLTAAQLQKRLDKAIVHIDATKDTKSIFFSDKGLRLTVNEDYAIIGTGYHQHLFNAITSNGMSKPYIYTKKFIEIALGNDCKTENGYSYTKLFEVLKEKEDQTEHNIATYMDWWFLTIFNNLYTISNDEVSSWLVYFKYMHAIATNSIILEEHNEDVTTKSFVDKYVALMKEFTNGVVDHILFPKKSDDELANEQMNAIEEMENDAYIQESLKNESKN